MNQGKRNISQNAIVIERLQRAAQVLACSVDPDEWPGWIEYLFSDMAAVYAEVIGSDRRMYRTFLKRVVAMIEGEEFVLDCMPAGDPDALKVKAE